MNAFLKNTSIDKNYGFKHTYFICELIKYRRKQHVLNVEAISNTIYKRVMIVNIKIISLCARMINKIN